MNACCVSLLALHAPDGATLPCGAAGAAARRGRLRSEPLLRPPLRPLLRRLLRWRSSAALQLRRSGSKSSMGWKRAHCGGGGGAAACEQVWAVGSGVQDVRMGWPR